MRPPASPSCRLYKPEAIGAYAPEGRRKKLKVRGWEGGKVRLNRDRYQRTEVRGQMKDNGRGEFGKVGK